MAHNYTSSIGNNRINDCFQFELTEFNTSTMGWDVTIQIIY